MNPFDNPKQFWNEKYATGSFIYGERPNKYFKDQLDKLKPGRLLLPAEGEGRNAVYAACCGWEVDAFDISSAGRQKALKLSERHGVSIRYMNTGYNEFVIIPEFYNAIGLIYAHMHEDARREMHRKLVTGLRPGGTLILEAFANEQIHYESGGPKDEAMLYSREELAEDFEALRLLTLDKCETTIDEGPHHQGRAVVIRITARIQE
ncbi:MAG: class I SAM-dependent methyltransferase [Balneolaceae bacterium]